MADSAVAITAGSGTNIDTRTEATNGDHRQVIVVGDPSTTAGVAPVSATNGLSVTLTTAIPTGANTIGALTANQSVNVAQINGVTATMGNGVSGTGVQRVTLASDSTGQVALAAGSATIGALTANQTVNQAQVAGVAVSVGNGVSGTGVQRVTLASDSTGQVAITGTVTVASHAVTNAGTFAVQNSAATPAGTNLIGAIITADDSNTLYAGTTAMTPKFVAIAAASNGNNTLIAANATKKLRVLALSLIANGTVNAKFQTGAGGTDLTGLYYLVANAGFVLPYNPVGWFETASNTLLNLNLSAAIAVGGSITYVEV